MLRCVEYKLYGTPEQTRKLSDFLEVCRLTYNWALAQRQECFKNNQPRPTRFDQQRELTKKRKAEPNLAAVPVAYARSAIHRVDASFRTYCGRHSAGQSVGLPRFKAKNRYRSFTFAAAANYLRQPHLYVPGIGLVRCRGSKRPLVGKQKQLRLIKRASGWYAQVLVDTGVQNLNKQGEPETFVGVDLGLSKFAAFSDGGFVENPRWYRRVERKLARAHRRVSRKKKGSKNREKAKQQLGLAFEKLTNQRTNFPHQESRRLVDSYDFIALEDLKTQQLIAKSPRARRKSIQDVCWAQFKQYVTYKAEEAGKQVVLVNPAYTSQDCSGCGLRVPKELNTRTHACPGCGLRLDRDTNAARNVLASALAVVGGKVKACGEPQQRLVETGSL